MPKDKKEASQKESLSCYYSIMKLKLVLIILIAVAVIGVVGFMIFTNWIGGKESVNEASWIEVLKPIAFELKKDNDSEAHELKSGDELGRGAMIKTSVNGFANIYIPDGSIIRIDSETKFTLEKENFNPQTGKLTVKIVLSTGRVWSKIFELATPDSLWEVKTTNTVATVRGTAFGMEQTQGKTLIIGSENKIVVSAVDFKSGKIIEGTEIVILPGQFVEIKDEDVINIKKDPKIFGTMVKDAPKELLEQEWIKRARKADEEHNKTIEQLKENGSTIQEVREQIFKPTNKSLNDVRKTEAQQNISPMPSIKFQSSPTSISKPEKLILETKNDLSKIIEGDIIQFQAVLVLADGSKVDVTNSANWQVLGPIGKIEKSGIFVPKLNESVTELGESFGVVTATWKDKNGENLLGKSPVLNVKAKIEEIIDQRG